MNSHIKTTKKGHISLLIWSIFLFLFSYTFASASTYYVSNTGSDSNNGTSTSTPWQTLAKVNASTFIPGDSILFKKGDTFYGSITVSQSGTSGNPITFSSYGTGNQPIITGFTDVTSWTNLGNNIWESTNTVSTLDTVNMVTVNGTNTAMGRYPNADTTNGGYLTVNSHSGTTSITCSSLTGTPNWTGAEAVVHTGHFIMDRSNIVSQSGGTVNFSSITYAPSDGNGFFIQNDSRTLDQQNEWYYNSTTHKIQMYSTSQPTGVKVASVDKIIQIQGNYLNFEDITFTGANGAAFYSQDHNPKYNNISIKNSSILYSGVSAMNTPFINYLAIENNIITESNINAIIVNYSTGVIIRNNTIQNIGIIPGMRKFDTYYGDNQAIAADVVNNLTIEFNTIKNTGYNPINFYGNSVRVNNNFIDTFCTILDDGGGIYTYTGDGRASMNDVIISNNIVINGTGSIYGTNGGPITSPGIYLDERSKNVEVSYNSVSNTRDFGILLNTSAGNINVHHNTVYNASLIQFMSTYWGTESPVSPPTGNQVKYNIFIAKIKTGVYSYEGWNYDAQKSMSLYFARGDGSPANDLMLASTTFDYNYYARPVADDKVVRFNHANYNDGFKTFEEWQAFSSQDLNSKKSPVTISSESDIFFDYNATTSNKQVSLPWPAVDMDGVKHTGNVTILPYSSVIYLKDPNPASSDTTAPSISSFTIPTTSSSLTVPISTFTATDTVGVTGYLLTESSTTPSAASGSWSSTVPTSYVFSTEGSKTLYAWAKDAASNVSTSVSDTVTITLPPVAATTFTLTGPSSGNINTASTSFTITPNNTYTGTITITPSGTASTGLSAITKTFSSSSVAQTFTITPTVAGSITLSPSNNGGLTNPANLTYTVTSGTRTTPTTFYVSNTGSDSNNGTSTSTPWQTLAKVNASTFIPGDSILFKKGDTFYGSITVSQSGTSGNPITFSSYGTGNQPIITGFTDVTSWTNLGNNIWESTNTVSTLDTVNMVTVNGTNTAMGRTPNTGYYYYQSHTGDTSITSSSLTGVPNWTGAELAFNNVAYDVRRVPITSQTGSTLTFTQPESFSIYDNNLKFIIQNDPRTLDKQNEWYYNPTTHKIQMYSASQPVGVKVASVDKIISSISKNYIIFDNISFAGSNSKTFYIGASNYFTIQNCQIKFSGLDAVFGSIAGPADYLTVENCTIDQSNNGAIGVSEFFTNAVFRANTITNSSVIYGASSTTGSWMNDAQVGYGISAIGPGSLFENNIIENTGYIGIRFKGTNTIVRNNFINNFCQLNHDGGGLYTWNGANTTFSGTKVLNNIVTNIPVLEPGHDLISDPGIYLDIYSNGVEISDNSVSGSDVGIFLGGNYNILVQRNIVFNTARALRFYSNTASSYTNTTVLNNIFVAKTYTQLTLHLDPIEVYKDIITMNNNYYARPIDDNVTIESFQRTPTWHYYQHTLSQWQTFSSQDTNSKKSPVTISSESDIFFDYNATTSNKQVSLPWPAVDMDGVKHTGNVTILPYSSVIYLKDPNPASSDTTAPSISSFTIPTTSSSLTVPISTFTATDTVGVTGYLLTESSTTPSAASGSWSSTVPASYVFSTEGSKTLYAWAKDAASNVSTSVSDTVTITLPPVTATTFTLTGPSSGNINTASTNFTITPNNTYTGTITITPSGTASTGLSTITKTFSSSSVAQTFTITPTVAGSITLSPSNNGGLTNPANLTYTSNAVVPGAPTSVSAVAGNASATVSFLAPSSNGGSTITGYTVTSSPAGGTDTNAGSTSLSHSITGLTNGTSYTFTVKATNAIGQSVASAASSAVTPQTNTFTLTINKSGTGSGTVTGGGTYNSGTSVTAGATPSTGSTFTSWSGDCNTSGQVTMTANKVCTATFTLNTYSIVSSTGTNGNISPLGTTSKNYATNQTYTITPSTGYHIVSVLVDGVSQGAISTYTFTNVTANHTISATFDIDVINGTISNVSATATSTSSITANWTTSVSSDSQVEYGLTTSYGSTTSVNTNLTTSHSISIPNLKRNTTYHYRVKSVDATSNILQSTDQIIKTLSQLTKTPKVRTLTASNGSVNLSWLAPLDPDGNTYELYSGVIIMRSTTSFIQSVDTATAIADIKSPTMTYHDTDVVNGTTYYYTFFAYDNLGVYSDPEFISFTPTQAVSSGGGGGGGGGSSSSSTTTTTTTSTLSSKAKAKDIKQDGSINIFDFNIIMANWNQTYSTTTSLSKGDMTGDGIINIFDINQLMIYWGVGY